MNVIIDCNRCMSSHKPRIKCREKKMINHLHSPVVIRWVKGRGQKPFFSVAKRKFYPLTHAINKYIYTQSG